MDKSEFWILASAVHYTSPIDILATSEENILCWFGWPGPDLTRSELVNAFHRLFQTGDLVATRTDKERDLWFECFTPTMQEIEAGLSKELYFDYGLTAKGGLRWEEKTQADWLRFFRISLPSVQSIIITGSDRHLIEYALEGAAKSQDFDIIEPVWEVMQPWPVTYWKTLPIGHQVTYRYDYSKSKTPVFGQEPYPPLPTWYAEP